MMDPDQFALLSNLVDTLTQMLRVLEKISRTLNDIEVASRALNHSRMPFHQ